MRHTKWTKLLASALLLIWVAATSGCADRAPVPAAPNGGEPSTPTLSPEGNTSVDDTPEEAAPEENVSEEPVAEEGEAAVDDPVAATQAPAPTETTEDIAASVNGQSILLEDYELQVARYEASMVAAGQATDTSEGQDALQEGRRWVLDMMVEQALIEQAAAQQGITVSDSDVDAAIASLRDEIGEEAFNDWLTQEDMSLDEMRERLRKDMVATQMANLVAESVPAQAEHVHARHILVNTEEEAQQVINQLQAGGDFASLARTYSQDISTRDLGGDLGFFPRGLLTSEEVEAAAFGLQPGQVSDVVQSALGYHVIQVVERVPDQEVDSESLRVLKDKAVRTWLDDLRASADLQFFITP